MRRQKVLDSMVASITRVQSPLNFLLNLGHKNHQCFWFLSCYVSTDVRSQFQESDAFRRWSDLALCASANSERNEHVCRMTMPQICLTNSQLSWKAWEIFAICLKGSCITTRATRWKCLIVCYFPEAELQTAVVLSNVYVRILVIMSLCMVLMDGVCRCKWVVADKVVSTWRELSAVVAYGCVHYVVPSSDKFTAHLVDFLLILYSWLILLFII
jgi:hypothetical protein